MYCCPFDDDPKTLGGNDPSMIVKSRMEIAALAPLYEA